LRKYRQKKSAKATARRKLRGPKKSTLADYKRALEIQKNEPAKFDASRRLQAIVKLWHEANGKAWIELSRIPVTADFSRMEAASKAADALSPRGQAIIEDLDFGDAIEVLVPPPQTRAGKHGPEKTPVERLAWFSEGRKVEELVQSGKSVEDARQQVRGKYEYDSIVRYHKKYRAWLRRSG
jgi:DNA polymerase III epsilon subunit-like protein